MLPEGLNMQRRTGVLNLLFLLLFLVSTAGLALDNINIEADLILDGKVVEKMPDVPFIPADIGLPVEFRIPLPQKFPQDMDIVLQQVDSEDRILCQDLFAPDFGIVGNHQAMTRITRVTNIPSSREIIFRAGFRSRKDGIISNSIHGTGKQWRELFRVQAVKHGLSMTEGWYAAEADLSGSVYRWCRSRGKLEFPALPFPVILAIKGKVPIAELPGGTLGFTIEDEGSILFETDFKSPEFSVNHTLYPVTGPVGPSGKGLGFPLDYRRIWIHGDRAFTPETEAGSNQRILSFSVTEMALRDHVFSTGVYGSPDSNRYIWTEPVFTVLLSNPKTSCTLYIQGKRDVECSPGSQTLQVTLPNGKMHEFSAEREYFAISKHIDRTALGDSSEVELSVKVFPMFFKAQCMDSDDNRPYGVAISEIILR